MENRKHATVLPTTTSVELQHALTAVFYHSTIAGPMSLKCAVELGIPGAVARASAASGGYPVAIPDIVAALPLVHPSKSKYIPRILDALVQLGVLTTAPTSSSTSGELGYLPTPFSSLLADDGTSRWSLAKFVEFNLHPSFLAPWHHLGEWFRRGSDETAFEVAHGEPAWGFLEERPELAALFHDAMAAVSSLSVDLMILQHGDELFRGLGSLVDVGGGTGATAKAIKKAFPEIQCTVLDLPYTTSKVVQEAGGGDVNFVAGDMFEEVPAADAILLKGILHNWKDEDCIKILKKCKDAIPINKGRVIMHDVIMNSESNNDPKVMAAQLSMDLTMMMAYASKERNELEWQNIFKKAGFKRFEVKQALNMPSIMVGYP